MLNEYTNSKNSTVYFDFTRFECKNNFAKQTLAIKIRTVFDFFVDI